MALFTGTQQPREVRLLYFAGGGHISQIAGVYKYDKRQEYIYASTVYCDAAFVFLSFSCYYAVRLSGHSLSYSLEMKSGYGLLFTCVMGHLFDASSPRSSVLFSRTRFLFYEETLAGAFLCAASLYTVPPYKYA